jgi:hypothetical protein
MLLAILDARRGLRVGPTTPKLLETGESLSGSRSSLRAAAAWSDNVVMLRWLAWLSIKLRRPGREAHSALRRHHDTRPKTSPLDTEPDFQWAAIELTHPRCLGCRNAAFVL